MKTKVCPRCKTEKPISEYWVRRNRKGNQSASRCKICSTKINKEWRDANPGYEKRRYQETKVYTREKHLKRKYGVDLQMYNEMLISQNGVCAICGKLEADENHGVLHVDHCHETNQVRGLLCRNCNHVLGLFEDKPDRLQSAIKYLSNPPAQIPEIIGRAIMEIEHE